VVGERPCSSGGGARHFPRLAPDDAPRQDRYVILATPAPAPVDPSWVDVWGFWVGALGTLASTVIAVVAVVLSVSVARAQGRRDTRAARAGWAHEYSVWLGAGTVYMAAGMDAAILTDREWIDRGNDIQARGRLIESKGANDYMVAARAAFAHIATMPIDKRMDAAMTATRMLPFWLESWVDDPDKRPGDIVPWIDPPAGE
jgi:hypothetical protein